MAVFRVHALGQSHKSWSDSLVCEMSKNDTRNLFSLALCHSSQWVSNSKYELIQVTSDEIIFCTSSHGKIAYKPDPGF